MLLNPEDEEPSAIEGEVVTEEAALPSGIGDVLQMCGIGKEDADLVPEGHLQSVLKKNNAGVDNAAAKLGELLRNSDSDAVSLNAAKMIMQLHGHLTNDPDDGGKKGPVFNITIVGKQQQNILNVLIPSQT
jgi:hypothetical protein